MNRINVKKKGNAGENKWANWLRDNGIKAWKDGQSGGGNREKADVGCNVGMHFEVKTVKGINIKEAWKQTNSGAFTTHSTPVLAIHLDGMAEGKWLVVMDNDDWIRYVKKEVEIKEDYKDPKIKWDIINAKEALRKLLKHYD